jgi:nucleoside-diphosphate-sugar epimerase
VRVNILITGDAGFVGRHFHKYLAGQGHTILGIDIVNGVDARDFFRTNDTKFDLVIHLAAVVGGRATIEGEPLSLAVDLSIDAEMFGWALRTKPGKIVYFSSSAAYPTKLQSLRKSHRLIESDINLDDISNPDLTYGWAKLTGEMLANHARNQGLDVYVFRPFSGYGSDQDLSYPFPSFIERGKRKANPFQIWGDGNQVRDFIHIDDIVEAVFAAIDCGIHTVNLATGRATSFNELGRLVVEIGGFETEFEHILEAPRGVSYRVGDPTLMNTFYRHKISLEEGIERAFAGL